jgi:hypothetical protein
MLDTAHLVQEVGRAGGAQRHGTAVPGRARGHPGRLEGRRGRRAPRRLPPGRPRLDRPLRARGSGLARRPITPARFLSPSRKTRGAHGKGQNTLGRRAGRTDRRVTVPSACRECGVLLETSERVYCPDCLPGFKRERTEKLVSAARSVLAEMRGSERDPAQSDDAKAKRVAAYRKRKEAARAWEQDNPGPHDTQAYRAEILPSLAGATLPQMMRATGLTSGYCWKIRRGERIPHPMYWGALRGVIKGGAKGLQPVHPSSLASTSGVRLSLALSDQQGRASALHVERAPKNHRSERGSS